MNRRLTRQGQARKAQLLECAAALFAERGYQQTRVIDIVRSAGVAKGLFYWYFDNKETLFRELIATMREELREEQVRATMASRTPLGQVFAGTRASVRFMASHHELYALLQLEGQTGTEFTGEIRQSTSEQARDLAVLLRRAQDAGEVRADDDPVTLAYGVLGSVIHLVYFHRTGRVESDVDALASSVARFVTRAVAADVDAARRAEDDGVVAGVAAAAAN